MPFEITPVPYVPPGTPVEPPNTTTFGVAPVPAPKPRDPDSFIQWQAGGYDLGDDKVLVVNFVYPLLATRGVGEHENVITVRRVVTPPPPPRDVGYFTSILYPLLVEDEMGVSIATLRRGYTLRTDLEDAQVPVPAIVAATLEETIHYKSYGPQIDDMVLPVPALPSGTLEETIHYKSYGPQIDDSQVPVPLLLGGTLVLTIRYISYVNAITYPDNSQVPVPALLSGTLT